MPFLSKKLSIAIYSRVYKRLKITFSIVELYLDIYSSCYLRNIK